MVTKEQLKEYRSCKAEIEELKYKLKHLHKREDMIGNDTIFDYRSGYPQPQAVVGPDWEKFDKTEKKYERMIESLEKKCREVEEFVDNIPDSLTRRIFRMYFIEEKSQKEIADLTHLDRSRISRKIDDFLKNAHKAQKAHV